MIFFRANWLGLGMFVASGIVALIAGFILKLGDFRTMVLVGILLIMMDLAFRFVISKNDKKLFGQNSGGYFFFVPVWILGVVVILINMVNASGVLKK